MKKSLLFSLFAISLLAISSGVMSFSDTPAYENFKANGKKLVFADFKTADYKIIYNLGLKKAHYKAIIEFDVIESGRVIFDAVTRPLSVSLDGKKINIEKVSHKGFRAMYLDEKLSEGTHTVEFFGEVTELVDFSAAGRVRSAFWFTDLEDRNFLERFMPSSFEYDRVKMSFHIKLDGAATAHKLMVNGELSELAENEFYVDFPDFYNSSSIYFHLLPTDKINLNESTFTSIDGRELPVKIYHTLKSHEFSADRTDAYFLSYMKATKDSMKDLESRFGPFLHEQMIVYATDGGGHSNLGGMEYCGATITNRGALNHEIIHSYFGRGIMPANGNAGWIDEAITTWAASKKYRNLNPRYFKNPQNLYGRSDYVRITHTGAYGQGMRFMGGLAGYLELKGENPFTDFLKEIIEDKKYTTYTNNDFWSWSKDFYGTSFLEFLERTQSPAPFVSGFESVQVKVPFELEVVDDIHKKITLEDLKKLL